VAYVLYARNFYFNLLEIQNIYEYVKEEIPIVSELQHLYTPPHFMRTN